MKFKVIETRDVTTFERKVNEELKDGWNLGWGTVVHKPKDPKLSSLVYIQTLWKSNDYLFSDNLEESRRSELEVWAT